MPSTQTTWFCTPPCCRAASCKLPRPGRGKGTHQGGRARSRPAPGGTASARPGAGGAPQRPAPRPGWWRCAPPRLGASPCPALLPRRGQSPRHCSRSRARRRLHARPGVLSALSWAPRSARDGVHERGERRGGSTTYPGTPRPTRGRTARPDSGPRSGGSPAGRCRRPAARTQWRSRPREPPSPASARRGMHPKARDGVNTTAWPCHIMACSAVPFPQASEGGRVRMHSSGAGVSRLGVPRLPVRARRGDAVLEHQALDVAHRQRVQIVHEGVDQAQLLRARHRPSRPLSSQEAQAFGALLQRRPLVMT